MSAGKNALQTMLQGVRAWNGAKRRATARQTPSRGRCAIKASKRPRTRSRHGNATALLPLRMVSTGNERAARRNSKMESGARAAQVAHKGRVAGSAGATKVVAGATEGSSPAASGNSRPSRNSDDRPSAFSRKRCISTPGAHRRDCALISPINDARVPSTSARTTSVGDAEEREEKADHIVIVVTKVPGRHRGIGRTRPAPSNQEPPSAPAIRFTTHGKGRSRREQPES